MSKKEINKQETYNKLTIVLSIRDNHKMTTRWLNYALKKRVKFKIIIADGSKNKLVLHEKFSTNLNIKVVSSEYDKDHITFMKKLSNVINNFVDTEFSLLADNDDFYIFTKIEKYVTFLINNKDYAGCCGNILKFELKEIYKGKPTFTTIAKLKDFKDEEPIDRLFQILEIKNYREIYYDVMYSKILGAAIRDFIEINSNDVNYRFLEFYILVKVLSSGKLKTFDDIFLLRQEDYQSSTSNDLGTFESIFLPNWSHMYFNLLNYAYSKFKIDAENLNHRNLITEKFTNLFKVHVAEKIINSGKYKITFFSFFRSKIKDSVIFNIFKYIKKNLRIYIFYLTKYKILNNIKKTIF